MSRFAQPTWSVPTGTSWEANRARAAISGVIVGSRTEVDDFTPPEGIKKRRRL
jgi:hypothetical protein